MLTTLDTGQGRIAGETAVNPVVADRFECRTLLNEGQGVQTWLGIDRQNDEQVIIKAISRPAWPVGILMRLEHEASLLRRIRSRWLPALLHTGYEQDDFVLVASYIPGISLRRRLQQESLSLRESLTVAHAIFSALRDMHGQRVYHRGVRPTNIVVDKSTPLSQAVLIDFGPVHAIDAEAPSSVHSLETALYLSPEQAGSIDHDYEESSDLFSAGITLFHCLAGRTPILGDSVGAILFAQMTAQAPELRSLGIVVPRAVDDLIQRLLRKDPRDRYQSAEAVLADLELISEALDAGDADPEIVIGACDRRDSLTEPAFVARREELQQLDRQLELTHLGRGGLVLLEGESGSGKSRLLVEAAQRAVCEGFWVLRGQATAEVARQPFQLLDGVVEGFLSACNSEPGLALHVQERLGVHAEALLAALPKLANVLSVTTSQIQGPEAAGEQRSIQALALFLDVLGTMHRPALIILDDCQWADELTHKLVRRWQAVAPGTTFPRRAMVIAAFRAEEVPPDHLLRRLSPHIHLNLAPFNPGEVRYLIESMAGPLPGMVVDLVVQLADGSPFMASAILRGLVETAALVPQADGWQIENIALSDVQSSSYAASFLTRRLELLSADTLRLLSSGAVLGKEFELHTIAQLLNLTAPEAIAALDVARQRRLVWVRPDGATCVFVHDRIRSALLERHGDDARRELHRRVARHLLEQAPTRVSDLAHHFDAAGEAKAALPYAIQAAEQARARHALEIAEQQYRIAERGADSADVETQYRILEGLGEVLMLRGRYDAAGPLFERAAMLATSSYAKAQIRGKIAELAFKRGDMESAIRGYEIALRTLGRFVPRRQWVFIALLLWEILIQALHTVLPWLFVHRRKNFPNDSQKLELRLFSGLGHGCWYCRSVIVGMWAHLRGLNLGERFLPTCELANAYSEHAPALTLLPMHRRAIRYAQKSLAIRQQLGDLWGQGQSLHYYGIVLYAASRFSQSVDRCREAIRLLERMGDYWQVHIARYQIAASLYHLGDLRGALEEARLNHQSGLETGDELASGIILDVWARATGGMVPDSVLQRELNRDRHDAQGAAQVLLAEGIRLLGAGDSLAAAKIMEDAIAAVFRAGVKNAYTLPLLTWAATAWRHQAELANNYTPFERRALLKRAKSAAKKAVRSSRICANDLPQAYRELGLILAMQGRVIGARRALRRSLSVARKHQARHQHALTILAVAKLGRELGWPEPDANLAEAEAVLTEVELHNEVHDGSMPAAASLSLTDRFDTVLHSGRLIASALSMEAIYEEARTAALRLLRAEKCWVLQLSALPETARGETCINEDDDCLLNREQLSADVRVHTAMVRQSLETRRPVAFVEERPLVSSDSAAGAGLRSSLCVPIHVRGTPVACLYAIHEQIVGLFKADEERLADFIATIAGAALENAEGFAQLQQLNETLERRVADRTLALESRAHELAVSNQELERVATELRQTQEQLSVAKQAAETANQAKSRFLAAMSHEIRTPMNGVIGMTELALGGAVDDQQRNYLRIVKQSARSLLALLNDILDFSKIEAGRMELEQISFPIRETVGDAVRVLAVSATEKGLELICDVGCDVPPQIVGDPSRLRQVLVNLVGNAIKFTTHGEIVVRVDMTATSRSGQSRLHFAIHDTGIGIPADRHGTIFEAFRQSDRSTTRCYGGTGLGLAISAQLVDLMQGQIWVESELGHGSTFHFTIPVGTDVGGLAPAMVAHKNPATNVDPLHQLPVLLFSTNASSRRACQSMLEQLGLVVTVEEDWESALNILYRQIEMDDGLPLVVIDFDVTSTDALSLVSTLRSQTEIAPCTMVALTPAGKLHIAAACREHGISQCLTKPVILNELADALRAAIGSYNSEGGISGVSTLPASPPRSLRILVADDNPVNQEVAAGLLTLRGHQVVTVDNGRDAVEACRAEAYDIVLMDVEMPEIDGFEATSLIRCLEGDRARRTKILAMTAHALKGFREKCLEAGMDDYVSKPIEPDQLFQAVEFHGTS